MSEAELTAAAISALANILLAGAAVAAAIAAFSGLSTWKDQNIWVADRETARSLIKALIRLENVVNKARHPVFWAAETQAFAEASDRDRAHDVVSDDRTERAHIARLNAIHSVYEDIEALLIEAEALWGNDFKSDWKDINLLISEYFAQTHLYLKWSASKSSTKDQGYFESADHKKRNYDLVFADPTEFSSNAFSKGFAAALLKLRSRLGEKMGKRQ